MERKKFENLNRASEICETIPKGEYSFHQNPRRKKVYSAEHNI